jgi:hypothetical protein
LSDCQAPQWLRRSVGWNVNGFISTKWYYSDQG